MTVARRPEVSLYHRHAAHVTLKRVLHRLEKEAQIEAAPRLKRKKVRLELEQAWREEELLAAAEGTERLASLKEGAEALERSLERLQDLRLPELLGKVEAELIRVRGAQNQIQVSLGALEERDFGTAGLAAEEAGRALWLVGGPLVVTLNQALSVAAIGRPQRARLVENLKARQKAKSRLNEVRTEEGAPAALGFAGSVHSLEAEGFELAAEFLSAQVRGSTAPIQKIGREGGLRVIPPQELESFSDVGGLEDVKAQLRATVGAILERPDEAAKYKIVHNGILFHGPPGTGKTLLSRALAGEYGLRYLRFSPASIASAYIHEAAANLEKLFELGRQNTPCLLFLDEIDTIASARDDQPSVDHREVVTQLMNCLEEYRGVPGLVIVGATNNINLLDAGLREGRFDAKIQIPLPDPSAREAVIKVHLERRGDAVDWSSIDLAELAKQTGGRNAAALESFVSLAAQIALKEKHSIRQEDLVQAIRMREGKDRMSLDQPVTWEDVVLPGEIREQLGEILNVFMHPDLARSLGVKAPAGLLLHGPPGTGKTTIAKAIATEVSASFYELSAAELLSKWAGESEERVAKLFTKARANRPSVIFIDEIDGLLRRRSGESSTPWEERVVSQFLRELDGLASGEGVLLVGATNRLDIIDPAIQGRRLTPIEVGLPDAVGRLQLLRVLCTDVNLSKDVNLKTLAGNTEGMSGADLKRLRDAAGMKALSRAAKKSTKGKPSITMTDFRSALDNMRSRASLVQV